MQEYAYEDEDGDSEEERDLKKKDKDKIKCKGDCQKNLITWVGSLFEGDDGALMNGVASGTVATLVLVLMQ